MNLFQMTSGEGFEFNMHTLVQALWKATVKDKLATQQSTEATLNTDGANLTKNLNIVIMGLKETDVLSSLPLIGSHLLKQSNNENDNAEGQVSMQRYFHCIPLKCIFAKASTDFLQE